MSEDKHVRKLRKDLEVALAKRRDDEAIDLLEKLVETDPKAPRWPHKRGELLRKRGRNREAIECYAAAADLYADTGFLARAVAMAKTIIDLDARRIDVLQRLDPEAARKLHRQQRPRAISTRLGAGSMYDDVPAHPAILREGGTPQTTRLPAMPSEGTASRAKHAAVLAEDDEPPAAAPARARHAAVILEDDEPPPAAAPARARHAAVILEDDEPPPAVAPARVHHHAVLPESDDMLELAEELTIAPDVKPHETRFSNAPPSGGIELDLTDLELKPRTIIRTTSSLPPPPPSAKKLSQLPLFPLFAELPQGALVDLVTGSEIIELSDGAFVARRGEAADALYGIIEGSVDMAVPGQQLKVTLSEGDVFGESCLLAGETRSADVIARGRFVALKITRQVFNQVIAAYPRLAEILLDLLTRRLLTNLLQTSPLFQEFDARGRQELVRVFEVRRAPKNTTLAHKGKAMDGLYISLTGRLDVSSEDGQPSELHEAGTMFGQVSLLTQAASDVTVRASSNMLVLRLPAQAFHRIAMQYPGMLAHLSELVGQSVAKIGT